MWQKIRVYVLVALAIIPISISSFDSRVSGSILGNQSGNNEVIIDQVIEDDFYVTADVRVTINQDVRGDLFVAGGEVILKGVVEGDAYVAGGIITIDGDVRGNLTVFGGQVSINGKVSGNTIVAGGTVNLVGEFDKDVLVAGGQILIDANILDDLRAGGGVIDLKGNVGSDALVAGSQLSIQSSIGNDLSIGAGRGDISSEKIGGNLYLYEDSDSAINISNETKVGGERKTFSLASVINDRSSSRFQDFTFSLGWNLVQAIGLIILGLVISKLAPIKLNSTVRNMMGLKDSLLNMLVGFTSVILGTVLLVFLFITVIGWPLVGFLILGVSLVKLLSVPIVGIGLGKFIFKVFKEDSGVFMSLIIGVPIIQIFKSIPYIGFSISSIVFMLALGAILRMWWKKFTLARRY